MNLLKFSVHKKTYEVFTGLFGKWGLLFIVLSWLKWTYYGKV